VEFTAALVAELGLLTQALDTPGIDVADSMARLADNARLAVDSYLGLCVAIAASKERLILTVLDDPVHVVHVRTSLFVPLSPEIIDPTATTTSVALIIYAATPGAFVDLAADLAWTSGRDPAEFRLDEHRPLTDDGAGIRSLSTMSEINQALGVLIGRGAAPEEAERELYAQAAANGIDLLAAAALILASLPRPES
jgi:hypothetical protein